MSVCVCAYEAAAVDAGGWNHTAVVHVWEEEKQQQPGLHRAEKHQERQTSHTVLLLCFICISLPRVYFHLCGLLKVSKI